jgi:hypothetical protein
MDLATRPWLPAAWERLAHIALLALVAIAVGGMPLHAAVGSGAGQRAAASPTLGTQSTPCQAAKTAEPTGRRIALTPWADQRETPEDDDASERATVATLASESPASDHHREASPEMRALRTSVGAFGVAHLLPHLFSLPPPRAA